MVTSPLPNLPISSGTKLSLPSNTILIPPPEPLRISLINASFHPRSLSHPQPHRTDLHPLPDQIQLHRKLYYNRQILTITFQRTVRVSDNENTNTLPPGLGRFPLYKVEEYAGNMEETVRDQGGYFVPMYQREALWINLSASHPFKVMIYVGGVNAVSGTTRNRESDDPNPTSSSSLPETSSPPSISRSTLSSISSPTPKSKQDYLVPPKQLWLDGIASEDGTVRQFVAMPLGSGYSVEAQITGKETEGGVQVEVIPADEEKEVVDGLNEKLRSKKRVDVKLRKVDGEELDLGVVEELEVEELKMLIAVKEGTAPKYQHLQVDGQAVNSGTVRSNNIKLGSVIEMVKPPAPSWGGAFGAGGGGKLRSMRAAAPAPVSAMGLAAGGKIKQSIIPDTYPSKIWQDHAKSSFNVHIVNSETFKAITGEEPPTSPITAKDYAAAGQPYFDIYNESPSGIKGKFDMVESVNTLDKKGDVDNVKGEEKAKAVEEVEEGTINPVIKLDGKGRPVDAWAMATGLGKPFDKSKASNRAGAAVGASSARLPEGKPPSASGAAVFGSSATPASSNPFFNFKLPAAYGYRDASTSASTSSTPAPAPAPETSTSNPSTTTSRPPGTGELHLSAPSNPHSRHSFSSLSASYPLKLLSPTPLSSTPANLGACYMLAYGGGLVAGDEISLKVKVDRGGGLLLLTQGSTKVFKIRSGIRPMSMQRRMEVETRKGKGKAVTTNQRLHVSVAEDGFLLLLPCAIQPYASSSYHQAQRVILANASSSVLLLDWFTAGRSFATEKHKVEDWDFDRYSSLNEILLGDNTIMRERLILDNTATDLSSRMHPYKTYATVLIHGPKLVPLLKYLEGQTNDPNQRQFQAPRPSGLNWSFSLVDKGKGGVWRVAGLETEAVGNYIRKGLEAGGVVDLVGTGLWDRIW